MKDTYLINSNCPFRLQTLSYPLLCATTSHIRLGRTDHFLSTYYFQGTKKSPFRSFISFNSTASDIKYKGWMGCLRLRIQYLRETITYEATWCPSLKKLTEPANYQIPRIPILRGTFGSGAVWTSGIWVDVNDSRWSVQPSPYRDQQRQTWNWK